MQPKRIGVTPARELARRPRLFNALEDALPVRFEGRDPGAVRDLDALVMIGVTPGDEPTGLPVYIAEAEEPAPAPAPRACVRMLDEPALDPRLRGARLHDPAAAGAGPAGKGDVVLAESDDGPLWTHASRDGGIVERVSLAPRELGEDESPRARLGEGRFLALLPLVDFLRGVTAGLRWSPPPLRATFLLDDPNLHWRSYGHVKFAELADQARAHRYHVAMAMVPLDGWFAHPEAVRHFSGDDARLSLLFHGNNHVLRELARPVSQSERRSLLAQALRRIEAFEARSGVSVARVMAAPHGVCSEEMAHDMLLLGFEALCISRPYPWLARPPLHWLARPSGAPPSSGWDPATMVAGGLPVLLRRPFLDPPEDFALRAYLDQPIVLYGHHGDLACGLEVLAEWKARLDRIGDFEWCSLERMASTNFATRQEGGCLAIRMYSRRARLEVPAGIERISVELPPVHGDVADAVLCRSGTALLTTEPGKELALPESPASLTIELRRRDALDPAEFRSPAWRPWPVLRRVAGESRDRMAPVLAAGRSLAAG